MADMSHLPVFLCDSAWQAGLVAGNAADERREFFVSYTQADRAWAEWIAWQLEEKGYRVLIQAWDMVPGNDWTHVMHTGVQAASRTIAVLSAAYLESVYSTAEWEAAWRDDPLGKRRKLLVFRVDNCTPAGVLAGRVITDLTGLDESAARTEVIKAARSAISGRAKPATPPGFPLAARTVPAQPRFPGATPGQPTTQSRTSARPTRSWRPPRRPWSKPLLGTLIALSAVAVAGVIALWAGDFAASILDAANAHSRPPLTPSSGQSASFDPAHTLPPSSPLPSRSPDPLAGAQTRECFSNHGSELNPDLQPDAACLDGDFRVVQVLAGTIERSGCDSLTGDDWNYSDIASDQALCFTYLDSSPIYHASVDQCVFGPSGSGTAFWNLEPCQIGTFTVVGRFRDTIDTSECGSNSDYTAYFPVVGYPDLDEVLCLQMHFPLIATVQLGTCLLDNGAASNPRFSLSPCSNANVIITNRIGEYDDPNYCGTDSSVWWDPPGYPNLGLTVCYHAPY